MMMAATPAPRRAEVVYLSHLPRRGPVAICADHVPIPPDVDASGELKVQMYLKQKIGNVVKTKIPILPSCPPAIWHVVVCAVRESAATDAYASCDVGKAFASTAFEAAPSKPLYVTWVTLYSGDWTARPLPVFVTILETTSVARVLGTPVDPNVLQQCVLRMGMRVRRLPRADDVSVHIALCNEEQLVDYVRAAQGNNVVVVDGGGNSSRVVYHASSPTNTTLKLASVFASPSELAPPIAKRGPGRGVASVAVASVYPLANLLRNWTTEMRTAQLSDVLPSLMQFHHTSTELLGILQDGNVDALTWKHVSAICLVYMPIWLWHDTRPPTEGECGQHPVHHACTAGGDAVFVELLCTALHPPFASKAHAFPAWLVNRKVHDAALVPWDAVPEEEARRCLHAIYVNEWRTWLCDVAVPFWTCKLVDYIADRIAEIAIVEGAEPSDSESGPWRKSLVLLTQLRDLYRVVAAPHLATALLRALGTTDAPPRPMIAPILQCHVHPSQPLSAEAQEALVKLRNFYFDIRTPARPMRPTARLSLSGAVHEMLDTLARHVSPGDAALLAEPDYLDASDMALAPPCMQRLHASAWTAGAVPKFIGRHTWIAAIATVYKAKALVQRKTMASDAVVDTLVPLMRTIAWLMHYTETTSFAVDMTHHIDDLARGIIKYGNQLAANTSPENRSVRHLYPMRLDALVDPSNKTSRCSVAIQRSITANGDEKALDARDFYCPLAIDAMAGTGRGDIEDIAIFEASVLKRCHARTAKIVADRMETSAPTVEIHDTGDRRRRHHPRSMTTTTEAVSKQLATATMKMRGRHHPASTWATAYAASHGCEM